MLRSPDGAIYNLDPATSRAALAPVIDLLGGTSTSVTADGDDTVQCDGNGNPINALRTLTLDLAGGAQITVPGADTPCDDSWDLNYGPHLMLLLLSSVQCPVRSRVRSRKREWASGWPKPRQQMDQAENEQNHRTPQPRGRQHQIR